MFESGKFILESMSYTNLRLYSEIMHYDWSKLVTWLAKSYQTALFCSRVGSFFYSDICLWRWILFGSVRLNPWRIVCQCALFKINWTQTLGRLATAIPFITYCILFVAHAFWGSKIPYLLGTFWFIQRRSFLAVEKVTYRRSWVRIPVVIKHF